MTAPNSKLVERVAVTIARAFVDQIPCKMLTTEGNNTVIRITKDCKWHLDPFVIAQATIAACHAEDLSTALRNLVEMVVKGPIDWPPVIEAQKLLAKLDAEP